MIKKKVLCCGLILAGMLLSKLYSSTKENAVAANVRYDDAKTLNIKNRIVNKAALSDHNGDKDNEGEHDYLISITFAEESLPLDLPQVERKLTQYLSRFSFRKQQTYSLHKQAEKHLPQIAAILKSHGIPEDFKYIPLVESGMDSRVVSSKGAGGYWQFMPATARLYGLKVSGKVDERLNLTKSTHAAARYLKYLYREFGDWTLVAAAYNVGGGSLRGAIRRQKQDDYYKLKLNNETASYVYKLVSVKEIIENPSKHGYTRYAKAPVADEEREKNML
ncbi:Membrane-bound lytic murein transglycosylase D precursor [Sphingobacterium spiritivorum]|uniref:Transglycosylase SLT domain protein n=2 Tax=Sphingobacterium spiritivorum TaxID=258 RepID=D7VKV2_SPHSI|nr:transglycosylase SLT domain protein [Sphingobacterium spiritivorum ATCC 33861]QQT34222.1 lytic transglycosylase domain-containing protein [Sphingobacterium spiritivorum]SUI99294.1 Membrane-bound lytic murein transglycosylase D precursor [Sphingobacterium spiritivorum]